MHVTPITRDEAVAREWFEHFEGAGLDGVIAKRPDLAYEPDKRVMAKIKHVRTADCVLAGYRVHKSAADAIGSLLLGLYVDEAAPASHWLDHMRGLAPVGVIGAFPMARRRELFAELQPLVVDAAEHPWSWAAESGHAPEGGSRWNPKKDLSFVPLRPERVVEVRYDYLEGARFRHPPQFVRWRPDREPGVVRLRAARPARAVRPRRRPRRPPAGRLTRHRGDCRGPKQRGQLRVAPSSSSSSGARTGPVVSPASRQAVLTAAE